MHSHLRLRGIEIKLRAHGAGAAAGPGGEGPPGPASASGELPCMPGRMLRLPRPAGQDIPDGQLPRSPRAGRFGLLTIVVWCASHLARMLLGRGSPSSATICSPSARRGSACCDSSLAARTPPADSVRDRRT